MADATPSSLAILLVDPLAGPAARTRAMLESRAHRVTSVPDWRGAEHRLTLWRQDAVVMSITTPGTGDRSAIATLRGGPARWAGLPLLGTLNSLDPGAVQRALAAGCDQVLALPLSPDALEAALRAAITLRAPPVLLDADRRTALRHLDGPAALEARDTAAMECATGLIAPIFTDGATRTQTADACEAVATAMDDVGAIHAAATARRLAEDARRGRASVQALMSVLVATRFALRRDRMNATAEHPIWAFGETLPGGTT
jgi:CheY-like chemotaxis protein